VNQLKVNRKLIYHFLPYTTSKANGLIKSTMLENNNTIQHFKVSNFKYGGILKSSAQTLHIIEQMTL